MKKTSLYQFFRAREGAVMTEFLFCLPMLILLVFMLFESARLFITSVSLDLAILKSIQRAKNTPNVDYQVTLNTELQRQTAQLSPFFEASGARLSLKFYSNLVDFIGNIDNANANSKPLGQYRVEYTYRPFLLPGFLPNFTLTREVLFVQEHERFSFFS